MTAYKVEMSRGERTENWEPSCTPGRGAGLARSQDFSNSEKKGPKARTFLA